MKTVWSAVITICVWHTGNQLGVGSVVNMCSLSSLWCFLHIFLLLVSDKEGGMKRCRRKLQVGADMFSQHLNMAHSACCWSINWSHIIPPRLGSYLDLTVFSLLVSAMKHPLLRWFSTRRYKLDCLMARLCVWALATSPPQNTISASRSRARSASSVRLECTLGVFVRF